MGWFCSTYASKYIPIIASVSEHQPPTWPSYFMDINILAFLAPAGIIVRTLVFLPTSYFTSNDPDDELDVFLSSALY